MIGAVCWIVANDAPLSTEDDEQWPDEPRCRRITCAALGTPAPVIASSMSGLRFRRASGGGQQICEMFDVEVRPSGVLLR